MSNIYAQTTILEPLKSFDDLLLSYVDSLGNVDYGGIIDNPYSFNQYFEFIEQVSPESHPDYFKTDNSKKAYWINVYNALILKIMIDNPGKNILDIGLIGPEIFLKKFKVGGNKISPHFIEHKLLRKMNDPRIHFAINCASKSCPPLGNRILRGNSLDQQLEEKTIKFINDDSHVFIDHNKNTIYLNKIFKWFKKDFGDVHMYITTYLNGNIKYDAIKNYKIKYFEYDWSKNSSK